MAKETKKKPPPTFTSAVRGPGRPRTSINDLPDGWETILLELAQSGAGRVEWQCALGVHNRAYLTLLEDSQEFRDVIARCKLLAQAWWERLGRRGAAGQVAINAPVWSLNMKNRFRWREAAVSEVRADVAVQGQPKTLVRTVLPAVRHTTDSFTPPAGVVED